MQMPDILRKVFKLFQKNSKKIFLATNIVGGVVTTGLAVEAGYKSAETVRQMRLEAGDKADDIPKMEYVKKCAPHFVPTGISLAVTTASGIAGARQYSKETAAMTALAAGAEATVQELRKELKEKIGEKKATQIEDDIIQKHVQANPPRQATIITTGYGDELCYDDWSGRYFYGSIDRIKKVMNDMNARILREMYVSYNEFYRELGLKEINLGQDVGWNVDNQIDIKFLSIVDEEMNKVVLVIDHYNKPINIHNGLLD